MKSILKAVIAGLFVVLALQGAQAQGAAGDAEKKALVDRIIKAQTGPEFDSLLSAMANGTATPLVQQIGPQLQRVPEAKRDAARSELNQLLNAHVADVDKLLRARAPAVLTKTLAPLYTERFTTDELKQLVSFFESPVLKKYQDVAPEFRQKLVQGIAQDTEKTVNDKGMAFVGQADAILAKYGVKATPAAKAPKAAASAPAKK